MNDNQRFLSMLASRTHIGQLRIRAILKITIHTRLRMILLLQKKEYASLEARIHSIAAAKGILLRKKDPLVMFLSCRLLTLRMICCKNDTPTVSYMIQNCTQGMIDSLHVLHRCPPRDPALRSTAQRLLDCERSCIMQLQDFL